MSGNLGDTMNVMPVLSGISKAKNEKINLVVRDKMKNFLGFNELMEMQECIDSLKFESEVNIQDYIHLGLSNTYSRTLYRPWESVRYEEYAKSFFVFDFKVDDDFVLHLPEGGETITDKYIIGDRTFSESADQRRVFNALKDSGKFPDEKCHFLDYNQSLVYNAQLIRNSDKPFFTTFTGIAIIADLLKKETIVFYDDSLQTWDNKPISHSFNMHFYRDRNCELAYLGDF